MVTTGVVLAVLAVLCAVGALVHAVVLNRLRERRRLNALVERLRAEARLDEATRRTLQAMRDAVRPSGH